MTQLNDFMTRIDLSMLNDYVAANGKSVAVTFMRFTWFNSRFNRQLPWGCRRAVKGQKKESYIHCNSLILSGANGNKFNALCQ